ncbi:MAG: hypothetical protein HOM21_06950 [Halobacteriovoraceae bacterium]|nr:hypothetical protein [Halobacteriovoraceae bacterium]
MIKIIILLLISTSAYSAVLPKGNGFFLGDLSYSTSSALWLKGDEKHDYSGADIQGNNQKATRNYYQAGLHGYYGLGYGLQIGLGIRYGTVNLSDAPILGAEKDDTFSQVSELSLEISYQLIKRSKSDFVAAIRFSHPGKQGRHHPEFLSFNDFTSYAELELKHSWIFKKFDLYSLIKYKKTLTDLGNNHLILEEKAYYKYQEELFFGLGIDYLSTDNGFDIADSDFNTYFANQGFIPVWNKKESWIGLSILGTYKLNRNWQLDSYLHRKIRGKNTGISTTMGIRFGRGF